METDAVFAARAGSYRRAGRYSAVADGFDRLFLDEYPRVVSIAYGVLRDRAEAEDVAQEVFLAFHRRHSPVAGYAPAWLHRAAAHTALNQARARRRRRSLHVRGAAAAAVPGAGPEEEAERRADRQMVRDALARLPGKSAAVLVLRSSGLSYTQTAEALGVGVGQVGTMLRRAEARLLKEVQR